MPPVLDTLGKEKVDKYLKQEPQGIDYKKSIQGHRETK